MTKIEIFSDVVCPWCYVGKRNLEKALEILNLKEEQFECTLNWRSFQLNPQLKAEGILRKIILPINLERVQIQKSFMSEFA